MEIMSVIEACFSALIIAGLTHWIYRWRNPKCNGVLPPGSLGLPLIGEALELMIPSYSLNLLPFLKKRIQRYGKIFKTCVAGRTIIVSADPKFCHFIFQQDGKLFDAWSLDTFSKLFDQKTANMSSIHRYIRTSVLRRFGMDALKQNLLSAMEEECRAALRSWSQQESLDIKYASGTMALEFSAKQLFSYDPQAEQSSEKLGDVYFLFTEGLMSIPLKLPGTAHYKCLQNHKKALSKIREIVKERIASPERSEEASDFLDHMICGMKTDKFLTEEFMTQLLFGLLFVTFDSVSTALSLAVKLLEEHPLDEHEEVLKRRQTSDSLLTWNEYKSMTFTLHVINEVLRLANISPGLFRKVKQDVEVNGYTIPAGWGVMIATSALHMDPETYKDPTTFNPSRWKDCKSEDMLKNFMPFGWGMKQCVGAEYSRVLLATFLHVLVTRYQWKLVKGGEVCRAPMLKFRKGLHINFLQKHM
ncbi:cytochrome P450 87A3-like isoform X2 [Punica granatum]|uniref:Cytochrome P450 87A3-like isoform X2 n=1 Tax=Punica granatum TaxID=22663 RepID=A0A6P8E025_PUNGR|nr:cytochrome P450 87A3-like isoform X2 [Punica granatum]